MLLSHKIFMLLAVILVHSLLAHSVFLSGIYITRFYNTLGLNGIDAITVFSLKFSLCIPAAFLLIFVVAISLSKFGDRALFFIFLLEIIILSLITYVNLLPAMSITWSLEG